ncbi:ATP-binding cassette domain-containing protein [Streptomyces cirratus]|uniref:ATP-binding cassette domain-containing protein n=1 Tax=Streptomyces cirratus TaxID=68187 RepID=UPI0036145937
MGCGPYRRPRTGRTGARRRAAGRHALAAGTRDHGGRARRRGDVPGAVPAARARHPDGRPRFGGNAAARRTGAVLHAPGAGAPAADDRPGGGRRASWRRRRVEGVTFAYGPHAHPVLQGLDLRVRPGEHLAVVGPSGIGKSTLTALLAGLLTPDRGVVLVAGAPARPAAGGGPDPRRTLLPQQAYVFTASVRDNLTHLCPGPVSGARLDAAVAALRLGDLITRLGGYDAVLDPLRLSQGERQLLALGAAHLSPAPLLLLDEATCHLDPEAEEHAERALAARPGTLVVVAHRISSAARADRVLVLDGTRAVCGTHDELPARSALYRDLVGMWGEEQPVAPA